MSVLDKLLDAVKLNDDYDEDDYLDDDLLDGDDDDFLDEVCGFPSQPHDEFVDILGYAINDLYDEDDDIDYDVLSKSSLGM